MRKIAAFTVLIIVILAALAITLAEYLAALQTNLPLTSRIIVGVGAFLGAIWRLAVLAIVILISLFWLLIRFKASRRMIDALILKLPIVSPVVKKNNTVQMIKSLSASMAGGIGLADSLEIAAKSLSNCCFKEALSRATANVKNGEKLSQALKPDQNIYSPTVIQMIEVGEEAGKTLDILEKLGNFLKTEARQDTQNLIALAELVLLAILGGAVGFLAVSALQPLIPLIF